MGNHFSKSYGEICTEFHFIPDLRNPDVQDYCLKNCAYTGTFIGLLFLMSWWYGQSSFEKRLDPIGAANEERIVAIQERHDAQRAWEDMGQKHERAMESNLKLRAEVSKAFKDLPWLEQSNFELAEENIVQHNEIERLKVAKQKYDELLQQVCTYGMSAKRPEYYQQQSEEVQRQLEISNNLLAKAEKCVSVLIEEKREAQDAKVDEKEWLQAQLKKNSRSTAYWAKYRTSDTSPKWGIRCACTEPEVAYGLKDQSPKIAELEATVAARDLTITGLRKSHLTGNVRKNGIASTSDAGKPSLPSTEQSESNTNAGSQTATATIIHACEHEQQSKDLGEQAIDDAKTMEELRNERQNLKMAASNAPTVDAAEIDARAKLLGELATKDTAIERLQEEKVVRSRELGARDETIEDLRKEKVIASEKLATSIQAAKDLREEKADAEDELAAKNREISTLRKEKTAADQNATSATSALRRELLDSRKELADAREELVECRQQLGQAKTDITELETAQRELRDDIKQKNCEIDELEQTNQEIAGQPVQESAESLQRLNTANANLNESRLENANCKGQLETQTARISKLEAAAREVGPTVKVKDDRIASLEEQLSHAPSNDLIERQKQSHNEAISKKDENYRALYDLYNKMLDKQKLAETTHDQDVQSLNALRQSDNSKQLDLQQLWADFTNINVLHKNCDGRILDLTNQLRQGANKHTDLQTKYNTQATELDAANQNADQLQTQAANLRQENASLSQTTSSSDSDFEKYRVEGENRARPIWQANVDRDMSAHTLELEASELQVFKLKHQLQQAKTQANPLRELQIKAREDAVKAKEDALNPDTNNTMMDHDHRHNQQQESTSKAEQQQEIKLLEGKLAAAHKDAGDAKARNRGIQGQLTKEKKERAEEKARHERELKKEQEEFGKKSEIWKMRLEREGARTRVGTPS